MLSSRIEDALNKQINAELYSAYLYLSMSAYFESQNFSGMARWMWIQAQEEFGHATRFFNFINDRDGRVLLTHIEAPQTEWDSPLDVFDCTLGHEQEVSRMINALVDLSLAESDHAVNTFLQWFVTEQVEEEANAKTVLDKLKLAGNNPVALLMLDAELGQRTPPPSPTDAAAA